MSRLINIVKEKNEKTLPNTCSTIFDYPSHIDENQKLWCLGDFNQDSISSQHLELDQFKSINKLASFYFKKIELESECNPNSQLYDSVPIFESILTPVSLPDWDPIPELTLILVPIDLETEPPILIVTFH